MPKKTNCSIFTLIMVPVGKHIEIQPLSFGSTSMLKGLEVFQNGIVTKVSADVKENICVGNRILFSPSNLISLDGSYLLHIDSVKLSTH